MMSKAFALKLSLLVAVCSLQITARTQTANVVATVAATVETSAVPRLITYSGVLKDAGGKPLTGTTGVTFLLYKDEQGGAPLWLETQNVTSDKTGHYSVQLGATSAHGLPPDLFVSGEARWLAVQVVNDAEQERVLLVAVPYAMKAADAETIGGLPPSAFVLAAPPTNGMAANTTSGPTAQAPSSAPPPPGSSDVTTTGGTANTIPLFTTTTNIQNSILTQTAKTAINVGGRLNLPALGTATASKGFNSQPTDLVASVFNSGTATPVPQTFQWQAEPLNNDTTKASGTLNLLYATGTATPAETGLSISSTGFVHFPTGQAFPGVVTKVSTGTGLIGGPITSTGTISIDTSKVPQLASANTFTANQTVNGNLSANQLIATVPSGTSPLQVASTTLVPNLNANYLGGFLAGAFQPAGSYATLGGNSFTATQTVAGNVVTNNGELEPPGTVFYGIRWLDGSGNIQAHLHRFGAVDNNLYVTNDGPEDLTGVYLAPGATSWSSTSDERLKTDIVPVTGILDKIKKIRVVSFDMASLSVDRSTGKPTVNRDVPPRRMKDGTVIRQQIGSIAQDWVADFPQLVVEPQTNGQYYGLNYERIGVVALGGVKELTALVEAKDAEIKALNVRLAALEQALRHLTQQSEPVR